MLNFSRSENIIEVYFADGFTT